MRPILTAVAGVAVLSAALAIGAAGAGPAPPPHYSIEAIRFADSPQDLVAEMVIGAPKDERVDTVYAIWLIRGGGRVILFDSGFHHARWFKEWTIDNYLSPDDAVRLAGVTPEAVTDIVVSHAHWDHLGGIDLFPNAGIWIQKEEYQYYTGTAWQPGGDHDGIDPEDIAELVKLNMQGRVHLVGGDDVEIFPGIRAYIGGRHTYASQYIRVDGSPPYVLASDNVYLYRNLSEHKPSATFSEADYPANLKAQRRMIGLAGSADRVIPGHDALQFQKFPTQGRVATIQ
jgi:glyoxylase-like metal-dependent hydrolase (beta-lactamase superfamily II)